jgi:GNAT superfamily N-acetyltransferase
VIDCPGVPDAAIVRPLEPADVAAAATVGNDSLDHLVPEEFKPTGAAERARATRRQHDRVRHLQETDPEGCWVAELDGEVVGVALALVRDDLWGLSLFGVKPGLQGQGIGGPILAASLRYAEGRRGAMILSSTDPRAMRRYFRSGFSVRPCLAAAGAINRSRLPAGLRARPGDAHADADVVEAVSRHVRTATHLPDLQTMVDAGDELLVLDGRGFAVHRNGSPVVVAARDEAAARDLLWSCLAAGPPGGAVHVDFVSAGNDWAIAVALDAGLALSPDGPVFVRGEAGPLTPYLPSGAYL